MARLPPLPLASPVVVADTDVVSFLFKRDSRGVRYASHLVGKILVLSAQARAEFDIWPEERNWGPARRSELEEYLSRYVVEYPDRRLCRIYGQLVAASRKRGTPVPEGDAWHAATAVSLDVPLVSHNARHYAGVPGLQIITEPDTTTT